MSATPAISAQSIEAARAQLVLTAIVEHADGVATVEDIPVLPRLVGWAPAITAKAIADLTRLGVLLSSADGELLIRPRPRATA